MKISKIVLGFICGILLFTFCDSVYSLFFQTYICYKTRKYVTTENGIIIPPKIHISSVKKIRHDGCDYVRVKLHIDANETWMKDDIHYTGLRFSPHTYHLSSIQKEDSLSYQERPKVSNNHK